MVCEGPEDCAFFHNVIDEWKLPRFHIVSSGGNTKFARRIRAFRLERPKVYQALTDIVLVADNDQNPSESFARVQRQVKDVFGAAPDRPLQPAGTKPRITVLMIPWAHERGHLEKLCVGPARATDQTAGDRVQTLMDLVGADGWVDVDDVPDDSRFGKAWLRTYLAIRCRQDPFVTLLDALREQRFSYLIRVRHSSLHQIRDFLLTFDDPAAGQPA